VGDKVKTEKEIRAEFKRNDKKLVLEKDIKKIKKAKSTDEIKGIVYNVVHRMGYCIALRWVLEEGKKIEE